MTGTSDPRLSRIFNAGDRSWMAEARCHGMDVALFFPEDGERVSPEARAACAMCPVSSECREYGKREQGVWAGAELRERQTIAKRERNLARYYRLREGVA